MSTFPASQSVTMLLSLICLASCVERSVWCIETGVWRKLYLHAANTTSARPTSSSVPTRDSGNGRLVTPFILAEIKQLWAEDVQAPFISAATPGTHQASTFMRLKYNRRESQHYYHDVSSSCADTDSVLGRGI